MARKDSGSADATDPLMKMIGLRWRMSGGKVAALLPPTKFANYCSRYIFNRTANKETLDCDLDKKGCTVLFECDTSLCVKIIL